MDYQPRPDDILPLLHGVLGATAQLQALPPFAVADAELHA